MKTAVQKKAKHNDDIRGTVSIVHDGDLWLVVANHRVPGSLRELDITFGCVAEDHAQQLAEALTFVMTLSFGGFTGLDFLTRNPESKLRAVASKVARKQNVGIKTRS